uniref:Uncharacterized protein n=1 Tax=Rhizophora mucronata TaxID=61149 RepID=A0A2P2II80_RHIMU
MPIATLPQNLLRVN